MDTKDFDIFFFMPDTKENSVQFESAIYKNTGTDLDVGIMGKTYHIVLFKDNATEDTIDDLDKFEAVLVDPLEYVSAKVTQDYFGFIARKTTTSLEFVQKTFDKLKEI